MIDIEQIIKTTVDIFNNSSVLKDRELPIIDEVQYQKLHTNFLVPLPIKLDIELLIEQIVPYQKYFELLGGNNNQFRHSLALVNKAGLLHTPDITNGSLREWNAKNPTNPYLEIDFTIPTPVMDISSLERLRIFDTHWARSSIFKLEDNAEFNPHIDTIIPSMWMRLWGTSNPADTEIRYYDKDTQQMKVVENIEAGRIYLIDTSIVHDARTTNTVYQLILGLQPSAYYIVDKLIKENLK